MRKLIYGIVLGALALNLGQAAVCPVATLQFYLLNFGTGGGTCTLAGGQLVFSNFNGGPTGLLSNSVHPWSSTGGPANDGNSSQPPSPPFSEYANVLATPFAVIPPGQTTTAFGFQYTRTDLTAVVGDSGRHSDLNIDFNATGAPQPGGPANVIQGVYTEMTGAVCNNGIGPPCTISPNVSANDKFAERFQVGAGPVQVNNLFIEPHTPISPTCPGGPTAPGCSVQAINLFAIPTNTVVITDTDVDVRGINDLCTSCLEGFAFLSEAKQGIFTSITSTVPEPSTLFVGAGIMALLLAKVRRRRTS